MFKKMIALIIGASVLFSFTLTAYADNGDDDTAAPVVAVQSIKLYDRADLSLISDDPSASYLLMNDIDMKDADWTPIDFSGTFDGNGHTIYNLKINGMGLTTATTVDGNHKEYETSFAGFFSKVENAVIKNLMILNVNVNIDTENNCFAAGLAGYAVNTQITNCSVSGRVYLKTPNRMCGVAGLVGFGYGTTTDSSADVTLTIISMNETTLCEEFLGGVLACGYTDIDHCTVKVRGYASVHGYVHNGGLVGMHHIHTSDRSHAGYVRNCTVDAEISFFEHTISRRAYCKPFVGETLNRLVSVVNNKQTNFRRNESYDYTKALLPEGCENPTYTETVTEPTCSSFGYTTYTCQTCGYSYTDNYVAPSHEAGEWQVTKEPTYTEDGERQCLCTKCGAVVQSERIPKLKYVSSCAFGGAELTMRYKAVTEMNVIIEPADAANAKMAWVSSDTSVATVDESGNVTAVGRGTSVITCTTTDGSNLSASCAVNVAYTWWQWIIVILLFGWIWY